MNHPNRLPRGKNESGAASSRALLLVSAGVVLLGIAAYWFFTNRTSDTAIVSPPPPTSKQAVPELARELISEQQEEQAPDYPAALQEARDLRAEGKLADAQLLYFFAARGGYAPAALELGELYDPTLFDSATNLMDKPDAFQAYKWYQQALQGGEGSAAERLEALHAWVVEASDDGDFEAEQLLLQWE